MTDTGSIAAEIALRQVLTEIDHYIQWCADRAETCRGNNDYGGMDRAEQQGAAFRIAAVLVHRRLQAVLGLE